MIKLFTQFLLSILLLLFATSCSENYFPGGSRIYDRFDGIPGEFFYQTVGSCENGDLSFRVLSGAGAILWDASTTQSEADILTGQFEIFLNKDQTYSVRYREFSFTGEVFVKTFTSAYWFDSFSREIHFKNLGVGTVFKKRSRFYLNLEFTQNLNSVFLIGQSLVIRLTNAAHGLDTDRNQYCNFKN